MKKIILFLIFTLAVIILSIGFFGLYEVRSLIGRASVTQASFSIDNSYLFVSPLRALANGQEKIRLTIFVLNNQGLGVLGKRASLSPTNNLSIEAVQALTDGFGKAVFDISTMKAGEYYLTVVVDGQTLPQKAHLSFY